MERGQLIVSGRVNDIVQKLEGSILLDVRMTGDPENGTKALAILRDHPLVKEAKAEGAHLTIGFVGTHDELPSILSLLVQNGLPVASFAQREADLEDVFMKVTKGMVQ
jgi:ABC-2 type transport system ATP-binding protein